MPRKRTTRAHYGDYCEIRNGELYARINVPVGGGKYKIRRKKVSTRIEARQWAQEELDRIKHGNVKAGDLETFIDLAEWYKRYFLIEPVFERGIKVEGIKDYKRQQSKLDEMVLHFGPKRLNSFTLNDLRAYARHRREKDGVTQATINRDFALMRAAFRKAHESDSRVNVPKFPINTAAEHERDRVMSLEEERKILQACNSVEAREFVRKDTGTKVKTDKHKTNREHLRAIIILAVDTAMRAGEIYKLKWADIDFKAGTITILKKNSKTQVARKVGMTPRVREELFKLPRTSGTVFGITSARRAFATACDRAGIEDLHFHDLRHTATTRMIRAGIPIAEVMKITGHTQMRTFMRYLNLVDETVQTTAEKLAAFLSQSS